MPGEFQVVDRPDIVIVEGLNVLQRGDGRPNRVFVSDFFDFSIYIDADEDDIEQWYVSRFQALRETVFRDPRSFFHRYASLSDQEAVETATAPSLTPPRAPCSTSHVTRPRPFPCPKSR